MFKLYQTTNFTNKGGVIKVICSIIRNYHLILKLIIFFFFPTTFLLFIPAMIRGKCKGHTDACGEYRFCVKVVNL